VQCLRPMNTSMIPKGVCRENGRAAVAAMDVIYLTHKQFFVYLVGQYES